tara:strand:+ start:1537 stop:2505 length:969 start_codon:yes stop_codon:yes gene_type:complete
MIKAIAIIAGEPNSISSEIIFKSWILRKKYKHMPFFIIGSLNILNLQRKKLKYQIKLQEIKKDFKIKDLKCNTLPVFNINYVQKKPFQKVSTKSKSYILNCFNTALKLIKNKKIVGFINCPINKSSLFKDRYQGITEFLSKKAKIKNKEVMLIYNKKLSVAPATTHIPLREVSKKIKKKLIINKIITINNFYRKILNKKPNIAILGLNPHNYSKGRKSEEKTIIHPAIKFLKKRFKIIGPVSPDSSFSILRKFKIDVIFGMYHDQVLTPFKALFKYNAINITLGLPYVRISPDHGTAENIVGKRKANPESLIESIKFFNNLK